MGLKVKDPNGEWRSTGGGGGSKPNLPLQFTGAVEAIYDGSKAVTVEIPEGVGGGESNLLVVTVSSETGEWVSSHTYQEIKAIVDGGGEAVLRMNYGGQQFTQYELLGVNDDHATFRNYQIGTGLVVVSYFYINSDGTATYDLQYVAIPSDDHINELINTALGEVESNLLFVTLKTENGNYVSSHTYQEIKEFTDNGGDVVLCEKGTFASFFPLVSVSSTQAFFGKQAFLGQLFVSQGYNINADGTVTLDQQMIEIPSKSSIPTDDHITGLIDAYMEEALGGDY